MGLAEEQGQRPGGNRADAGHAGDLAEAFGRAFVAGDSGQPDQSGPVVGQGCEPATGGSGEAGEGEGDLLVDGGFGPRVRSGR